MQNTLLKRYYRIKKFNSIFRDLKKIKNVLLDHQLDKSFEDVFGIQNSLTSYIIIKLLNVLVKPVDHLYFNV